MRSATRLLALALVAAYVLLPVSVHAEPLVLAFTEAETEGDEPTVETPVFEPGGEPAVIAPADAPEERDEPWTARYLAPVLLVGTVLVAVAYFFVYGARVRGKYEVVD